MVFRQGNDARVQAGGFQAPSEATRRLLAGLVGILIESDINVAAGLIPKLGQLHGVTCVPIAQVVLRKPACQSTAKSNRPSTRIMVENTLTDSQANKPPLERGNNRCGKAAPILRP